MFKEVPNQFDFPKMEQEIRAFWEASNVYEKSLANRKGGKPFVFYEGPPTANGLPHPGHCLTRAIKDLFPRFKTMTGHYVLRKGGWDTHGLPVEVEVCKELGIHTKEEIEAYGIEAFNRKCLESVFRYTKEWEELTKRLGFWVNLEEAYVTYHKEYVESVWWSLKQLYDAGLLYQGHKIVWWWAQGGTALSAGEVGQGYREVDDPSVYVRFPIVAESELGDQISKSFNPDSLDDVELVMALEDAEKSSEKKEAVRSTPKLDRALTQLAERDPAAWLRVIAKLNRVSLLVWTTTPWTLPSNMFAAVHKDFDYAVVHDEETGERLIFAAKLVDAIAKKVKKTEKWKVERTVKGSELVGLRYCPPFRDCYYDKPPDLNWRGGQINSPAKHYGEFRSPVSTSTKIQETEYGNKISKTWEMKDTVWEHIAWRVLDAKFVTLDSGTGLVHEAPAFGEVDFDLWKQESRRLMWDLPLFCAVAPNGKFTDEGPEFCRGRFVKDCDKDIIRDLKDREAFPGSKISILLHQEQYRHDYPFCWRAEEDPLIQYPRRSWFIRTTQFKDAMLENNSRINWLPDHIKEGRFGNFLRDNVDWSLSRERYWGTPLPIWICDACGHMEAIDSYDALVAKPDTKGLEVWENAKAKEPTLSDHLKVHKPYIDAITYACPKCATNEPHAPAPGHSPNAQPLAGARGSSTMRRVPEVIDCWYDSGAMPFAQWGFPHKNAEMFSSQFPADFISEALDQTRGWFYSLTAISTLLFGKDGVATGGMGKRSLPVATREEPTGKQSLPMPPQDYPHPFRNCIVLGLLMGEDGLKMSKSKKNYKDPTYIFDHEGADAMRWLFFSGQTPWTSIRFQESAIAEAQREFLIRLYNCYSFFVIYANIDKWTPSTSPARQQGVASELDRWILSELAQCSLTVHNRMEEYDNYNAAKSLIAFVDALSNWYVRRSRDRFWKSGMDDDKSSAYATLHECLVTVAKLIAPFTPFIAESMYQNLVRTHAAAAPESIHLCDYPVTATTRAAAQKRVDSKLNEEIDLVRQLVSCGRAARSAAKLRVRQPLAAVELFHRATDVVKRHEAVIKDELNIKRIEFKDSAAIAEYVTYELKPDFKKIGPKHGPLAPKIKAALAGQKNAEQLVRSWEQTGSRTIEVEGQSVELATDEIIVELHAKEGYSAERIPGQGILVLDTKLTPALIDEGMARDLVNQVQQVRKNLNLKYEQRIDLAITGDDDIQRIVNTFGEYIMGETLATCLLSTPIRDVQPVEADIEGHAAQVFVKPH